VRDIFSIFKKKFIKENESLPPDAMHSAYYAVARCLSVCWSHAICVKTAKRRPISPNFLHLRVAILF